MNTPAMRTARRLALPVCLVAGLLGSAKAQDHVMTIRSEVTGDSFASLVTSTGDVNNDGFEDVLIGASGVTHKGNTFAGMSRVYSGREGRLLYTFYGDSANDQMGRGNSGPAGDVNKDGHDDILLGVGFGTVGGSANAGYVKVYSGKDGTLLHTFKGTNAGDFFGVNVAGVGDVNFDGHADIGVGGAGYDDPKNATNKNIGIVRIYSGKDGKVLYTFSGNGPNDQLASVAAAGDVNKDGWKDFLIAARNAANKNRGRAHVISGRDGKVLYTYNGATDNDFMTSVGGAGDLNQDGNADFWTATPTGTAGGNAAAGYVHLYSGKDGKLITTIAGPSASARMGVGIASGDVNKDGVPDLVVGSQPSQKIEVFNGKWLAGDKKAAMLLHTFYSNAVRVFSTPVPGLADVNNDGHADILMGTVGFPAFNFQNFPSLPAQRGKVEIFSGQKLSLSTDTHVFSISTFNVQRLTVDAGGTLKGRPYAVFGSLSGMSPGVRLGNVTVPLVPDIYTNITISLANTPLLHNFRGTLDGGGQAVAQLGTTPLNNTSLVGLVLYHAAVVFDNTKIHLATNPTTLLLQK